MKKTKISLSIGVCLPVLLLTGCLSNQTKLGGGSTMVTGSSGTAGAQRQAQQLIKCSRPIGTAALLEPEHATYAQYGLKSPLPLIRLMMAQSRCFQIVDRGAASSALQRERALALGGELQKGSKMGGGQMVAANYIITPNVVYQDSDTGGGFGALGTYIPGAGAVLGALRTQNLEAQVMLTATNVRSGVQEAIAEGSASKGDIDFGGLGWVGLVGGLGGAYADTDIGKITAAAFLDAHNKLVGQLQAMAPAFSQPDYAGYRTSSGVNFRSGPSTTAPILSALPKGTAVVPTGTKQGSWWEIEAGGETGWIHADYITR